MRHRDVFVILAPFVALLCLMSCSGGQDSPEKKPPARDVEDVKRETREALETAADFAATKKDEYVKQVEIRVGNLERGLKALQQRFRDKGASMPDEFRQKIQEASGKLTELRSRLEELREANADTWEDLKKAIDEAVTQTAGTIKELARDAKRAAAGVADSVKREEYRKSIQAKLEGLERRRKAMQERLGDAGAATQEKLEGLKKRIDETRQGLARLGPASADAWGEIKQGIDDGMAELSGTLEELAQERKAAQEGE